MSEELKQAEKKESKPKRKIIQISTSTSQTGKILIAGLCDDGTVWYRYMSDEYGEWTQVKPL